MKKIILALAFLVGSVAGAAAACTSPAVMHDFPGTSFNMSLATNAGDGNCSSNVTIVGTLPAYTVIPAFKIDQTTPGTTNLVALTAETTKVIGTVRNVGNVGGVFDAIGQNVAAPANWTQSGCQFNTTPTTITTGNGSPCQVDNAGNLLVNVKADATAAALLAAVQAPVPAQAPSVVIGGVGQVSQYPTGAVPLTASATGTTAATTATLAASASIKTYICGFSIRANATAAATANSTVTGTITGTLNYTQWTAPLASGLGITEQIFSPCIPSSAINTAIAVISAAPGTGGVVSVSAWGYQL